MKGIKVYVYPKRRVIHVFQVLSIVQEHQEERNPRDELLMVDLGNSSNIKYVNSWSDYNKYTKLPFVYQLALLEYHELVEDWDMENNYDPNIPKWVDANYPRTSLYDAKVNVLEEALPFQSNHRNKGIKGEKKIQNINVMIMWIQLGWFKKIPKSIFFLN
jgi:hypothetical protein